MKLYLVQDYKHIELEDKDSVVIALTPQACYKLDKDKTRYSIVEDYCNVAQLVVEEEDKYYTQQCKWIDKLDEFLCCAVKQLGEYNLKPGAAYYYFLKEAIDPLYIRCRVLHTLLEFLKPSEIIFICSPQQDGLNNELRDARSYYSKIIPLMCRELNIPLNIIYVQAIEPKVVRRNTKQWLSGFGVVSNTYAKVNYFRSYLCKQAFLKQPCEKKLNILVLRRGYGLDANFIAEAVKHGHTIVYQRPTAELAQQSWNNDNRQVWANTFNLLLDSDLIQDINKLCELDVSSILLPLLQHFITKVCPELLAYSKAYTLFYQEQSIDLVISPFAHSIPERAALAMARNMGITTVGVCHGDDVCQGGFWRRLELKNDILITSNVETKEDFKSLALPLGLRAKIYSSPQRFANMDNIRHARRKHTPKNLVVFLPTFMSWDWCRVGPFFFSDTEYYRFLKDIAGHLATRKEHFIWKCLPQSESIHNPMPEFIKESEFDNIKVIATPHVEHLHVVDRVVCDFPSTGFYESVIAKVPTISVYPKFFSVRASAQALFGRLLKPFSTTTEAISHIDEFLDNDTPELYVVDIDRDEQSILNIIEEEVP